LPLQDCSDLHHPPHCEPVILRAWLFLLTGVFVLSNPAGLTEAAEAPAPGSDEAIRQSWNSWNAPFKPFRIIGNIYYVGASGISSFLITTPQGHILIDTGFEMTVPRITNSLAQLGFRLQDIKLLLNSHAHLDHIGGHALMKSLTGAKICISEADGALLASGGTTDFTPYSTNMVGYRPAIADRLVRDGDTVKLGDATLTCHLTPGHTKGCTTWTMDVEDSGRTYHVLFFGSTTVLEGVRLLNNPKYPAIAEDYAATFKKLKALPCDVFLAPHTGFFNLADKSSRLARGDKPNPFIDPSGYRTFIAESERAFNRRLAEETKHRTE
jgi:metallo-beta-lactamase class B